MDHVVRRAIAADATPLTALALRSKAHWGYDKAFMAACREELTVSAEAIVSAEVWVCEDADGVLAGFFDLRREDDVAEVYDLFVDPKAMGHGVGRMLWAKLEELAHQMAACTIGIDADPHAVGYYERMGARVVGEVPSGSIEGRLLPRMMKPLDDGAY
jgi:GNAT superfamily N-acetyltransferase